MAKFLAEAVDTPVVYTSHNVEYERYGDSTDKLYSHYIRKKIKQIEEEVVEKSAAVVCTTEEDKEEYETLNDELFVIPNGINSSKISSNSNMYNREAFSIPQEITLAVFLGSDYAPNVEAVEWLCENWSELDESYHLLIIGNVGSSVQTTDSRIHTVGFVEDLMSVLSLGDIAINPVIYGGGSNVKILDYFAAELPVISTEFGVRGFDVSHKSEVLVGSRDQIIDYITELSEDEYLRQKMSENVTSKGKEYTWQSLSEELHIKLQEYI
jgi:glycosyltransferase involved in cell wall biosynthesis